MDIGALLLQVLPLIFAGGMFWLATRKAPLDREGQLLANYTTVVQRLSDQEEEIARCKDNWRVLYAFMRRKGWLTAEVEAEIRAELMEAEGDTP